MKEAINKHVWGMASGAKAVTVRKRKIIREDLVPSFLNLQTRFLEIRRTALIVYVDR